MKKAGMWACAELAATFILSEEQESPRWLRLGLGRHTETSWEGREEEAGPVLQPSSWRMMKRVQDRRWESIDRSEELGVKGDLPFGSCSKVRRSLSQHLPHFYSHFQPRSHTIMVNVSFRVLKVTRVEGLGQKDTGVSLVPSEAG